MRTAKGRVLRDTTHGDGLLSVEGNQYPFRLEGMWRSDKEYAREMREQLMNELSNAVSIGFGTWIAIAAGLCLACAGITRFRARPAV